ncbi:protein of unknown function DUF975 [Kipferlia bialata]|uniref:DUF975 family protein n=1 Tax=Kipferlia bialata TaxID=797122 RepID=A0A9K3CV47_9EUKA|nr:protein of unknown function DUF975 [Kipferlia bialata]|eukprot:g4239.t1
MLVSLKASQVRAEARVSLRGYWAPLAGATVLYLLLSVVSGFIPFLGPLLIGIPLYLGYYNTIRLTRKGRRASCGGIFSAFGNGLFWRSIGTMLLTGIFVLLWALLLIIPGIIAAFSYALAPWIILEDPTCGCNEALNRSKVLMKGNKWRLFCLSLSFIGWAILSILTLGIGTFWLMPYIVMASYTFYVHASAQSTQTQFMNPISAPYTTDHSAPMLGSVVPVAVV